MLTLHGKRPPTLGFQSGLQVILCDVDIKHCGGAVPSACADGPEVWNGPGEQREGALGGVLHGEGPGGHLSEDALGWLDRQWGW